MLGRRRQGKKRRREATSLFDDVRHDVDNSAKTLLANLRFMSIDSQVRVIVVTSAIPNEGKTFVASQLARAMATSGRRTLLMECDMRRRSLSEVLQVHAIHGMHAVMSRMVSLEEAVVATTVPSLYLLDSEPHIPNPSDLLSSKSFDRLLELARRNYDYVVIDTPPVGTFVDAAVVGSKADALIMVVREHYTHRDEVVRAAEQLKTASVPLAGIVMNFCDDQSSAYYYDYYSRSQSDEADGLGLADFGQRTSRIQAMPGFEATAHVAGGDAHEARAGEGTSTVNERVSRKAASREGGASSPVADAAVVPATVRQHVASAEATEPGADAQSAAGTESATRAAGTEHDDGDTRDRDKDVANVAADETASAASEVGVDEDVARVESVPSASNATDTNDAPVHGRDAGNDGANAVTAPDAEASGATAVVAAATSVQKAEEKLHDGAEPQPHKAEPEPSDGAEDAPSLEVAPAEREVAEDQAETSRADALRAAAAEKSVPESSGGEASKRGQGKTLDLRKPATPKTDATRGVESDEAAKDAAAGQETQDEDEARLVQADAAKREARRDAKPAKKPARRGRHARREGDEGQ